MAQSVSKGKSHGNFFGIHKESRKKEILQLIEKFCG